MSVLLKQIEFIFIYYGLLHDFYNPLKVQYVMTIQKEFM